jgi:hypothetical protein
MDIAAKEERARSALHTLALDVADKWASDFNTRPTQQLVLQKLIDPVVRHVLNSMLPWIIGLGIFFLVLLVCTVATTYMVIRSGGPSPMEIAVAAVAAANQ